MSYCNGKYHDLWYQQVLSVMIIQIAFLMKDSSLDLKKKHYKKEQLQTLNMNYKIDLKNKNKKE